MIRNSRKTFIIWNIDLEIERKKFEINLLCMWIVKYGSNDDVAEIKFSSETIDIILLSFEILMSFGSK